MSDNYPVDGELRRQAARIEALEQAHAELAAKVGELRNWLVTMAVDNTDRDARIAALESPAPAPDPVCANPECDPKSCARAYCFVTNSIGAGLVPTAEPEPPLDPFDLRERLTGWLADIELSQAVFSLRGLKVSYTPDELADLIVRVVARDGAR